MRNGSRRHVQLFLLFSLRYALCVSGVSVEGMLPCYMPCHIPCHDEASASASKVFCWPKKGTVGRIFIHSYLHGGRSLASRSSLPLLFESSPVLDLACSSLLVMERNDDESTNWLSIGFKSGDLQPRVKSGDGNLEVEIEGADS